MKGKWTAALLLAAVFASSCLQQEQSPHPASEQASRIVTLFAVAKDATAAAGVEEQALRQIQK